MTFIPRAELLNSKLIADETITINKNVGIGTIALPVATEEAPAEVTICKNADFNDGNPAVYETFTYTERDVDTGELIGVAHKEGTIQDWDAGDLIFSKTPATQWDQLRAKAAMAVTAREGAKNMWVSSTPPTAISVGDIWIEID